MSLSDHLPVRHVGPQCAVSTLPTDTRTELEELLAQKHIKYTHIAVALKAVGHPIPANSLSRHDRRDCQCPVTQ